MSLARGRLGALLGRVDREALREGAYRLGRLVFGDRVGLAVFLSVVLWCGALWRVGIFIQDTTTVANALANVAEGRLALVDIPYSLTRTTPGVATVDGQAFGRNYGQVFLAVPLVWLLEGLSVLVAPKVLLAAGWSLGLLGLCRQVALVRGDRRLETAGAVLAVGVFAGNLVVAQALPRSLLVLAALQLSTLLLAGYLAVVVYRLLALFHGRRLAVAAGLASVVATPVGFWATVPKRHVVTACAGVVVLYLFAVSRRGSVWPRAGAYAALGLLTTVHPFEAFVLFVVFAPVDLLTAAENDLRTLVTVGAVFACSLVPLFVVNTLVSGNPLESPRLVYGDYIPGLDAPPDAGGGGSGQTETPTPGPTEAEGPSVTDATATDATTDAPNGTAEGTVTPEDTTPSGQTPAGPPTGGADGGPDGGGGSGGPLSGVVAFLWGAVLAVTGAVLSLVGVVADAVGAVLALGVRFGDGVGAFLADWTDEVERALGKPERLNDIFVRGGFVPDATALNDMEPVDLTVLESFPLVALVLTGSVAGVHRLRGGLGELDLGSPRRQTDVLAVGLGVVFTLLYLPRLPLGSQITVRYILPAMPFGLYVVARLPAVRECVEAVPGWVAGGYVATVAAGSLLTGAVLVAVDPAIGEAMQVHALSGLAAAVVGVVLVGGHRLHGDDRAIALGVAVPAGVTTVFLLFLKVEYFGYRVPSYPTAQVYVLDLIRVVAEWLPVFS